MSRWPQTTNVGYGAVGSAYLTATSRGGVVGMVFSNTAGLAVAIGGRSDAGTEFTGRIDEVGFWKRVLNGPERTALYMNGVGCQYPFIGCSVNSYVYDGDGNRVQEAEGGTGGGAVGWWNVITRIGNYYEWQGSSSAAAKYYYAGDQRVAVRNVSGTLYFLLNDQLDSVSRSIDANGNLYPENRFYPFGAIRYANGSTPSLYTWTGQERELGYGTMFFMGFRYYDTGSKRFMSPDNIDPDRTSVQDLNRYSYSLSNPIKYTDPSGHRPCEGTDDGQCITPRYWQFFGDPFRLLQAQFGITLSNDGAKDWSQSNAWTAYDSISNIDSALNGRLAANIKGANVTFTMDEHTDLTGEYHGWTQGKSVTFYTQGAAAIRRQNIYHEFGHVLDNIPGLAHFSGDLGTENRTNPSWLAANGELDAQGALLKQYGVADPNYPGGDEAIQYKCTCAVEQWADIFANYVAGNINRLSAKGADMYNWANQELTVNFAAP